MKKKENCFFSEASSAINSPTLHGARATMAASTLRDLLSTTDSLFNKSDELNAELQRLVRAIQGRRAPAEAAEIVRLAAAGVDAASLQLLGAPAPGSSSAASGAQPTVLEKALADCRAASAAMCVGARAAPWVCCPRPPPPHSHPAPSPSLTVRRPVQHEPAREPQRRGGRARRGHSEGAGAGHCQQGEALGRAP